MNNPARKNYDHLIVGAGFAGSVCARMLAEAGRKVLLIDRRDHFGGNAYDRVDEHGVLIHPYGPHIFHTNSKRVFEFLSRFTDWRFYEHRVLAQVGEQLLPIPINRTTINKLYGLSLTGDEVQAYLDSVRQPRSPLATSEDVVLNSVGPDLCDKFFRGYTKKQWGLDLSELSAGVAARIPTRNDDDDRYFGDSFQFIPAAGYGRMFERMLDHPGIELRLNCDFRELRAEPPAEHIVYTGPIDAFFDHCHGPLPYRSLRFDHQHLADVEQFQQVGTVNYPNDHDYTRITEFKHLTGQQHAGTSIVREYPQAEGDPYYPIPRPENEALYKRYAELAEQQQGVTFVGRLAQYRYYNMDQIVATALKACEEILA
ncbi:UDP-galactopyranose mutase [Pelomonas sp. V22]|uniref:UDP-galactopyranose mutase n=1 Tax=Pelomonas sp. V22 TaxID=2822139 RepID=UPI0024A7D116|nr:UDP-galactopyranose mutase [Pelomonas sp. V22]MDI4631847.1 UDP-galactopyranose mutase [Pelomonas sp. V22]